MQTKPLQPEAKTVTSISPKWGEMLAMCDDTGDAYFTPVKIAKLMLGEGCDLLACYKLLGQDVVDDAQIEIALHRAELIDEVTPGILEANKPKPKTPKTPSEDCMLAGLKEAFIGLQMHYSDHRTDEMPATWMDSFHKRKHPPGKTHSGNPIGGNTIGSLSCAVGKWGGGNINLQVRFEALLKSRDGNNADASETETELTDAEDDAMTDMAEADAEE